MEDSIFFITLSQVRPPPHYLSSLFQNPRQGREPRAALPRPPALPMLHILTILTTRMQTTWHTWSQGKHSFSLGGLEKKALSLHERLKKRTVMVCSIVGLINWQLLLKKIHPYILK